MVDGAGSTETPGGDSGQLGRQPAGPRGPRYGWSVGLALVGVAAAALVAFLVVRFGAPESRLSPEAAPIEALVEAGTLDEAVIAIHDLHRSHPEREAEVIYLEGRVAAARGATFSAARLYDLAVRADPVAFQGHPVIFEQMVQALADPDCAVRSLAAVVLGGLGDPAALGPLREALAVEAERPRPPHADALCRFEETARQAMAQLSQADVVSG